MLTVAEVASHRKITNYAGDVVLAAAVDAVNLYVDSLPSIDRNPDGTWGATTRYGALLLAGRWYNRQYSISAVTGYGDSGETTFITRYDSDIARLLHIDGQQKPMVY